jgi:hypothetical protein
MKQAAENSLEKEILLAFEEDEISVEKFRMKGFPSLLETGWIRMMKKREEILCLLPANMIVQGHLQGNGIISSLLGNIQ